MQYVLMRLLRAKNIIFLVIKRCYSQSQLWKQFYFYDWHCIFMTYYIFMTYVRSNENNSFGINDNYVLRMWSKL